MRPPGAGHRGVLTPDICIVGAGSGGLSLAAAAAAFGVEVVLVERGRMGGDCLNYGCVPSKSLIAAARAAAAVREAHRFGVMAGEPEIDYAATMRHVRAVIASIAPFDSVERFTSLGVEVIEEEGRFLDERTLAAGAHRIQARRFVIATGSSPRIPDIAGLAEAGYLTNETLFDLSERPDHLLVLGGGPIGLEMAQAHRRLGSAATVVEGRSAMGREDADLAAVVLARMRQEGVGLLEGTSAIAVSRRGGAILATLRGEQGEHTIEASHLLVAAGRTPNTAALALEAAGIEAGPEGIRVGRDLRTSNRRVYAIGDVAGEGQFTHLANQHAGLVARAILFRLPIRQTPDLVPRVTYTAPEIGQVGPTEAEARARGWKVEVMTSLYADNDRARADGRTEGLLKMIVGGDGRLVGAGVVGENAGELVNLFQLAVSQRLTARDLTALISPYPTYAEIGKRAATAYYAPYARRGFVRAAVRFLSRFG